MRSGPPKALREWRMRFVKPRCRGEGLNFNNNDNFWKYAEVLELNRQTVANARPEFVVEYGRMGIAENEANA